MLRHMKLKTKGRPNSEQEQQTKTRSVSIEEGQQLPKIRQEDEGHRQESPITSSRVSVSSNSSVSSAEEIMNSSSTAYILKPNGTGMPTTTSAGDSASNISSICTLIGKKRKITTCTTYPSTTVLESSSVYRTSNIPSIVNVVSTDSYQPQQTEPQARRHHQDLYQQYQHQHQHAQNLHTFKKIKQVLVSRAALPIKPRTQQLLPLRMPIPLTMHVPVPILSPQRLTALSTATTPTTTCTPPPDFTPPILILARPEDKEHLNPIHYFVRRNIEVFVASDDDIRAPSPGRKNALKRGQVGLRCRHCRNVNNRKRTKRAVCYPSSIHRVYNCVSDMKFDHFARCKYLPAEERTLFNELRAKRGGNNSRGKGGNNTARYYYESAVKIGMVEAQNCVVLLKKSTPTAKAVSNASDSTGSFVPILPSGPFPTSSTSTDAQSCSNSSSAKPRNMDASSRTMHSVSASRTSMPNQHNASTLSHNNTSNATTNLMSFSMQSNCRPLASPQDVQVLNPIHCFVRNNVEVFIADSKDVTAPAPGRKKRVTLGQVGIRCIHCKNLPIELRVKRAICYPPTVGSLYHAVSNMKFDHFGACKGLSPSVRQHVSDLRLSSSRKKGSWTATSCTAKYYRESAEKDLGLIDTDSGISVVNNSILHSLNQYVEVPLSPAPSAAATSFTASPTPATLARSETCRSSLPLSHPALSSKSSMHNKCGDIVHIVHKHKQLDGMSALMLAATDSQIRQQYEEFKVRFSS